MNVSVVIPALNEESTVAQVVHAVAKDNPSEIIVIDSDSSDATAANARAAGAQVISWREIAPEIPTRPGKGEAMWRGVRAASGDVIVFVDADLHSVPANLVSRLCAPLADPHVHMVKADYSRTFNGEPTGGGRVTELTAKPLLTTYFPEVSHIRQPLGGEYALRRKTALELPFVAGYGVEAGLIIDIATRFGPGALKQVNVGQRVHRNRPLAELAPMADIVARTILGRAGVLPTPELIIAQRPAWNTLT
ncbi:glucosyl-3-phosphoglycerate synthase [Corynebacterium lubricantis]|uniref:glucosyl-3-phosphoglycerate synthase n=1 Tax=Corynebacterium lubricantis TaxID=541095 RepID=UPI0003A817C3|nr:glucosyl-3-phosphoglycerate synthase [Corynebacterium lubricantis]